MTESEWVEKYAKSIESKVVDWHTLIDKRKWNGLEGDAQKAYEKKLQEKAKKPVYRAWKNDNEFQDISKETFEWAKKRGIKTKTANYDRRAATGEPPLDTPVAGKATLVIDGYPMFDDINF